MKIITDKIYLKREKSNFKAGICLVNGSLEELLINKMQYLHPNEILFYNTLKFNERKKSYLLGRTAGKQAVKTILNSNKNINSFSIEYGVFKFLVVKNISNKNIQISISHTDNFGIAIAFPEEHPLAIDIEKIDNSNILAKSDIISNDEYKLAAYFALDKDMISNILFWTIKEALSKILKTGLMIDFKILEIDTLQKIKSVYVSTFNFFNQYKAISYISEYYITSIILPKNSTYDLDNLWKILPLKLEDFKNCKI